MLCCWKLQNDPKLSTNYFFHRFNVNSVLSFQTTVFFLAYKKACSQQYKITVNTPWSSLFIPANKFMCIVKFSTIVLCSSIVDYDFLVIKLLFLYFFEKQVYWSEGGSGLCWCKSTAVMPHSKSIFERTLLDKVPLNEIST